MQFNKPKLYKGQKLKGSWLITKKLDGVRMLRDGDGIAVSRSGKPLYNLEGVSKYITDAEVFLDDWETSVSLVRTIGGAHVTDDMVYSLDPLDERLIIGEYNDPTSELVERLLEGVVRGGGEGLVLRQGARWLKAKPVENYDVTITGYVEGKGKHTGRLGLFTTEMGNVGTGFTDRQREEFWEKAEEMVGTTIEVECMSLTPAGKFRHPRFVRERFDK